MSDDFDSRFEFTDNQGHKFPVWAGSQAEAWNIAQRTIAAHDAAHQREQAQADAEREARSERVQSVIDAKYDRVRAKFDAQISAGCDPRSGLLGVTHVPFEERDNNGRMGIDAAAAMQGNGSGEQMQPIQYGKKMTADQLREYYRKHPELLTTPARQESKQDGGGACLIAVLCVVLVVLFIWMLTV